jgi:hypothetical protein
MNNLKLPNFILTVVSIIVLFIGIMLRANGSESGTYVIIASVILGGIHWIWSIIDVVKRADMKPFQKRFWLIAVIAAPAIGSMLFYIMHQRSGKIVT